MKKGVFITCPGFESKVCEHPWQTPQRVYNNRELDLEPQ